VRTSAAGRLVSERPALDAARGRIGGMRGEDGERGDCLRVEIEKAG